MKNDGDEQIRLKVAETFKKTCKFDRYEIEGRAVYVGTFQDKQLDHLLNRIRAAGRNDYLVYRFNPGVEPKGFDELVRLGTTVDLGVKELTEGLLDMYDGAVELFDTLAER